MIEGTAKLTRITILMQIRYSFKDKEGDCLNTVIARIWLLGICIQRSSKY
jgi:hypothetical protein